MIGAAVSPSHLLNQLENILDSDPLIDEVGFVHPSQFAALNQGVHGSNSSFSDAANRRGEGISQSKLVEASTFFWHSEHKLGISTHVLVPLYSGAKEAFMDTLKRYRRLTDSLVRKDELLDSASSLDTLEDDLMKHSRALLLISCDFGTAWNFRKLVVSKKQLFSMFEEELLLSNLVLSYSPKSERAWSHRRWVIKMIAGKCPNLQEIVEKESELVKTIAESSKMNYRAWNHRCWLVSYIIDAQVVRELQNSRDWSGLHAADNSCFHYRARLLLWMTENLRPNDAQDVLSCAEFHQIWKEELDWVGVLIRRYVGREALWLHRRFLTLLWLNQLATDDQSISCRCCCSSHELFDISKFVKEEITLFHSCTILPDNEFGDYQAQATYAATYITWLAKQMPLSFGAELKKDSEYGMLRELLYKAGKKCLWDSFMQVIEAYDHSVNKAVV